MNHICTFCLRIENTREIMHAHCINASPQPYNNSKPGAHQYCAFDLTQMNAYIFNQKKFSNYGKCM